MKKNKKKRIVSPSDVKEFVQEEIRSSLKKYIGRDNDLELARKMNEVFQKTFELDGNEVKTCVFSDGNPGISNVKIKTEDENVRLMREVMEEDMSTVHLDVEFTYNAPVDYIKLDLSLDDEEKEE